MTEEGRSAFDDAVRLLARRGHPRRELEQKLNLRGHTREDVASAFERLASLGYLEAESDLAQRYAEELARKRGATPASVLVKMRRRGFEETDASTAVQSAFAEWNARMAALETVDGVTDPIKAARRLTSRGFPSDAVAWVVSRLKRRRHDSGEEDSD